MFQSQFMMPISFPLHAPFQAPFSGYSPLLTPSLNNLPLFGYAPPIYSNFGYSPYYGNLMHSGYTPIISTMPAAGYAPINISTVDTTLQNSPYEDDAFSDILDAGDPLIQDTANATPQFFTSRLSSCSHKSSSSSNNCDEFESTIAPLSIAHTSSLNIKPLENPLSISQVTSMSIQSSANPLSITSATNMTIEPSTGTNQLLSPSCSTTLNMQPIYLSTQNLASYRFILGLFLYCIATRQPNQSIQWQTLERHLPLIMDDINQLLPDLRITSCPVGHTIHFHGPEFNIPFLPQYYVQH